MDQAGQRPRIKPRWGPRAPQRKIRQLYESVARGLVDDALLDDVGFTLYLRCKSILIVRDIYHERRLPCPACGQPVNLDGSARSWDDADHTLQCGCGWTMAWGDYWATFRHQELGPGGAADIFEEYVRNWEAAQTEREKILAIDRVLHQWHWETKDQRPSFGLGRPTGVNLVEGSRKDVIAFLDSLSYGTHSPDEAKSMRESWRAGLEEVKERQARWRNRKPAKLRGPE